jgi:hypothetical protein
VEIEFGLWGNSRLKLLIDIWNIFNADYYSSVASTNGLSDAYLEPVNFISPRRAQLGFRFVF